MKTLKELNSKWYWRLIKTIYFSFFVILLSGTFYLVFNKNEILTYAPETIKLIENLAEEEKNKIEKVKIKYQNIAEGEILYQEDLIGLKSSPEDIRVLLALHRSVWGLEYEESGYSVLNQNDCNAKITEYLNTKYSAEEPMKDIVLKKCGIHGLRIIQNYTGGYDEDVFYYFLGFSGHKTHPSYSLVMWNIIYCIGYLILFTTISLVLRSILYYIIFGKVFPPK